MLYWKTFTNKFWVCNVSTWSNNDMRWYMYILWYGGVHTLCLIKMVHLYIILERRAERALRGGVHKDEASCWGLHGWRSRQKVVIRRNRFFGSIYTNKMNSQTINWPAIRHRLSLSCFLTPVIFQAVGLNGPKFYKLWFQKGIWPFPKPERVSDPWLSNQKK